MTGSSRCRGHGGGTGQYRLVGKQRDEEDDGAGVLPEVMDRGKGRKREDEKVRWREEKREGGRRGKGGKCGTHSCLGFGRQVLGILLQRFKSVRVRALTIDLLAAANLLRRLLDGVGRRTRLLEDAHDGRVLDAAEDEVVLGDERVALVLHDALGLFEDLGRRRREGDIVGRWLLRREADDVLGEAALHEFGLCAGCCERGSGSARGVAGRSGPRWGGRSDEEAVRRASASLRSWTGRGEWERTFVEDGVEQGLLRLARGARRWREKGREEVDRCHLRVRVLLGELDGLLQRLCRCFGELVHVGYWR